MNVDAGSLFAGLVVSSVGFSLFLFGKKQAQPPALLAGILLMALPIVIPGAWLQLGTATAVIAGLWLARRAGW